MKDELTGWIMFRWGRGRVFSHKAEIGAEGSGKLVTRVRKKAVEYDRKDELVIIDGSPGIGCQ